MSRITQSTDGSYQWDCPIDQDFHKETGRQGIWAVLLVCLAVLAVFFVVDRNAIEDLWIPLLVIGVILLIAVPLLLLWHAAPDPHEQYVMTADYVKSGYGKGAIFSEYGKTYEVVLTKKYLEMIGQYRNNRIYVPEEDMAFVRDYILERLPENAVIRRKEPVQDAGCDQ